MGLLKFMLARVKNKKNHTFVARFSKLSFVFLLILYSCVSFISCETKKLPVETVSITKADGSIIFVEAEIAIKEDDQMQGLMFRKKVPDGTGMLFVFDKDKIAHFWMKNTPTALSIAYIDYKGEIKDILDMEALSEDTVSSTSYVRYALEVRQGWFKENGVRVGDFISPLPKP